jgi:hypothetical protein
MIKLFFLLSLVVQDKKDSVSLDFDVEVFISHHHLYDDANKFCHNRFFTVQVKIAVCVIIFTIISNAVLILHSALQTRIKTPCKSFMGNISVKT